MADRFENGVLGLVPQQDWLSIPFNPTRQNDPIDALFNDQRTDNLVAYWQSIANEYQVPMMANFHGFDTEAQTTFRVPVDTHNIEKGLIKVKLNQSERMRALTRAGVRQDEMYDYVIRDGARLAEQVITRTKVAKNELMAYGKVTIHENNLDLTVDYGVPDSHIDLAEGLDLSEKADLVGQLQDIIDKASAEGQTINGLLTARANITKMRQNKSIQGAINGALMQGQLVRQTAFSDFLQEEFGIATVITNDLTYGADAVFDADGRPHITTERYYPSNHLSFYATGATGRMGVGLWGDPPETDVSGLLSVGGSTVSPYVYITQWSEKDPAVLWTKASALFMPIIYNPNSLWIKKVKAATGE